MQGLPIVSRRVLRPDGVLAIWCHQLCTVNDECDAIVESLYSDIVGEYWPPERVTIERGYAGVTMPGIAVSVPEFVMSLDWRASDMLGYLRTWSACKHFEVEKGFDPVGEIAASLEAAWGDGGRLETWPLAIQVSRPNTLLE